MRLPPHVMALELRLFNKMLEKAAGNGPLPDMLHEFAPHLGKRELTLDCPREEILASAAPSFVFVMNEELLGVYPTGNGLHIKKPLKGDEQVMVLKPGFKGEVVYYYDSKNHHLFILHDDMRKLNQYDLSVGPKSKSTIKVHGLIEHHASRPEPTSMLLTKVFVFILLGNNRLFCIDREAIGESAQAKLIWSSESTPLTGCSLVADSKDPLSVMVVGSARANTWRLLKISMRHRMEPLCFREVSNEQLAPPGYSGSEHVCDVYPIGDDMLALRTRTFRRVEVEIDAYMHVYHPPTKHFGPKAKLYDTYYSKCRQMVYGGKDILYSASLPSDSARPNRASYVYNEGYNEYDMDSDEHSDDDEDSEDDDEEDEDEDDEDEDDEDEELELNEDSSSVVSYVRSTSSRLTFPRAYRPTWHTAGRAFKRRRCSASCKITAYYMYMDP
ncbi:hypothetical protein FOL47_009591 [Perkinsus chesapeaki]|uniref:Neuropathy target esterase n=1 Tax=Perkinsus chesapeaki TaxID=330153 RepID=A0A7J6MRJ0_PERCH|nr:hypothetical protein FOL47_009591 [Perkinsus chesapeaki]